MKRTNSDVMERIVFSLCESIDSPRSLAVWLCFKHDHKALLELCSTAIDTSNSRDFALDYFISSYLSKYKGLKTGIDTRAVALEGWISSEVSCKETNRRFQIGEHRPLFNGRVEAWLFAAQRKIASVLGPLNVSNLLERCRWGPGATFDLRRKEATTDEKISGVFSVTATCLPYFRAIVESDPHWIYVLTGCIPEGPVSLLPQCFKIVEGSRLLTVPKSAKTDRTIAAEPTGNSFCQQGVRRYLRSRLRRFGINLDDQSINQAGACNAYSAGLSTLDLSAASDTISQGLVRSLLPLDWWMFLDSIRSKYTLVEGKWIRTEKFVSMGNAFCFELETLIFWALASSVASGNEHPYVTVYGDDIIIERRYYHDVVELLTACGFKVNPDKSFRDGNFFESCGKHFHKGIEVTPVFQKEVLDHPSEIIRAHNRIFRFEAKWKVDFSASLRVLRKSYPWTPIPYIPYGVTEDGGFLRDRSLLRLDPNHGFRCRVLDFVPKKSGAIGSALYAYNLRLLRDRRSVPDVLGSVDSDSNITQGTWRSKVRWIPYASTNAEDVLRPMNAAHPEDPSSES